ncbi:MAG: DUF1292 domain-containing protein [Lachnospiraceae bacterium]|nr:DUF1292 domain-containing protein [Lachnospiraceae bacterium]MBP5254788.1 DUF1292 domain-containing protein [Lachnospiraceae bacterium]
MSEQIVFETDEGEVLFYVLEQTRINGVDYLLVSESEDEEAECLVLKDLSGPGDTEAVYETVTDDAELDALLPVFSELLEDT